MGRKGEPIWPEFLWNQRFKASPASTCSGSGGFHLLKDHFIGGCSIIGVRCANVIPEEVKTLLARDPPEGFDGIPTDDYWAQGELWNRCLSWKNFGLWPHMPQGAFSSTLQHPAVA
ncbi:hypothetical protein FRIGORI9N_100020 [Frigoribacterium sp. 9N]|nr:hypothetical protein FRIGORI9N_100020 [Frigoribacterium sp. 9N]